MVAPLALIVTVVAALQQGPAAGTIRGEIKSSGSRSPLRFATLQVVGNTSIGPVTTDSSGGYVLRNLPAGWVMMRVTHIDHAPDSAEVLITEGKEIYLDFVLDLRPFRLPAVTTRGVAQVSVPDTQSAGQVGLVAASVRALESTPGVAELGLAEIVRDIPGHEPPDPSDVLYVRGGAADLKLVLLDGAPVYAPFHLGGLINPLDPDILRKATLYLGGAPARYDGGLSYVMDLETRAGRYEAEHASISADLLGGRMTLEGPVAEHVSYLIAGRGVHGLGTELFTRGPFPYLYGDALTRLDFDLGRSGRVTTTGFWNRESVQLDSLSGYQSKAVWGNTAGSIRYRGEIGGSNADLTFGMGVFRTELPVGGDEPLMTEGLARRARVGINLDRPAGPMHMYYGLQFDRIKYEYRAWPRPRTERSDSLLLSTEGAGEVAGTYIDVTWQPARRLRVRGGLRADVFSVDPRPRLAPRASATLLLNERASITIAAGRYRQYVRASDASLTAIGTADDPMAIERPELNIASASHLVLGLDQELVEGLRIGIEGYYKDFEGLPEVDGDRAEASGLDLWIRRPGKDVTGWLGYSLAWVRSADAAVDRENFSGRHLVSAGVSGPLGKEGRFELRVAYGAGLPYTAIPEPETPPIFTRSAALSPQFSVADQIPSQPAPPDEPYLRIDLQVAHTFITDVRGFAFELTPYVKVLNALDRRDALFYHFDRNAENPETRPLAPLPILPVLGLEWRF